MVNSICMSSTTRFLLTFKSEFCIVLFWLQGHQKMISPLKKKFTKISGKKKKEEQIWLRFFFLRKRKHWISLIQLMCHILHYFPSQVLQNSLENSRSGYRLPVVEVQLDDNHIGLFDSLFLSQNFFFVCCILINSLYIYWCNSFF